MDKDFKRRGCVHVANYAFMLMEKFMRREPMKQRKCATLTFVPELEQIPAGR